MVDGTTAPSPWDRANKIIPFFAATSISSALAFYTSVLGFIGSGHPDPPAEPTFASILCGPSAAVNIYIVKQRPGKQDGQPKHPQGRCMVRLDSLEDLKKLYDDLNGKGIEHNDTGDETFIGHGQAMIGKVEDQPWGYRQFDLWDPDGNLITFFVHLPD